MAKKFQNNRHTHNKKPNRTKGFDHQRTSVKDDRKGKDSVKFGTNNDNPSSYINSKIRGTNEFGWYNKNPGLIDQSTKVSFYNVLGNDVRMHSGDEFELAQVPGALIFDSINCPGYARGVTTPANQAAIMIYEKMRSTLNKLNPNYEAPDVFMYLFSSVDIFAQYENLVRCVGLINSWDANNLYVPKKFFLTLYNFAEEEFDYIIANKANIVARLNFLLKFARAYVFCPVDFSITARHAWLYGKYFKDHNTKKAQLYAYRKAGYYKFDETYYETGTCCKFTYWPRQTGEVGTTQTFEQLVSAFEESIYALRDSTAVRDITSDLRHAFQDRTMLQFADFDVDYYCLPNPEDQNALKQIENMETVYKWDSGYREWDHLDVTQNVDTGAVEYAPRYTGEPPTVPGIKKFSQFHTFLNFHVDDPTKEDITEATRNKVLYDYDESTNKVYLAPNADFVIGIEQVGGNGLIPRQNTAIEGDYWEVFYDAAMNFSSWATFDWAPMLRVWLADPETGDWEQLVTICEWDTYTDVGELSYSQNPFLANLQRVCCLSLWDVDEVGPSY